MNHFTIPHSNNQLTIRFVLIEKTIEIKNEITFCCTINGIAIYSDGTKDGSVYINPNDTFLIAGINPIILSTDSFYLNIMANIIHDNINRKNEAVSQFEF